MTVDSGVELRTVLRQQRKMMSITTSKLSRTTGVSQSYLSRIEKGERFPSARILRKLAKALGFSEIELFSLAGYLSPNSLSGSRTAVSQSGRLDPVVVSVLSEEPVEIQRAVVDILRILKIKARSCEEADKR